MLKKSTKEFLMQDLLDTKQMLINHFDDKDVPFIKGGAIDQFYTSKALEFQRNAILYDSILNSVCELDNGDECKIAPLEKIAVGLMDLSSSIENHE